MRCFGSIIIPEFRFSSVLFFFVVILPPFPIHAAERTQVQSCDPQVLNLALKCLSAKESKSAKFDLGVNFGTGGIDIRKDSEITGSVTEMDYTIRGRENLKESAQIILDPTGDILYFRPIAANEPSSSSIHWLVPQAKPKVGKYTAIICGVDKNNIAVTAKQKFIVRESLAEGTDHQP